MRVKTLVAVAVAAAFVVPLSTYAQSSKPSSGTSAGAPAAPSAGGSADKNKDGTISRDEAKGTPYEKDFSKLDKDGDGKLSASEQAAAGAGAGSGSPAPKK